MRDTIGLRMLIAALVIAGLAQAGAGHMKKRDCSTNVVIEDSLVQRSNIG